jgi:hypothetical protein
MKGSKKMKVISARVEETVLAEVEALANAKEWTVSKYLEKVIKQHLEEVKAKTANLSGGRSERQGPGVRLRKARD